MRAIRCSLCLIASAVTVSSCLPADDRPPPGSLSLTVSPSTAVTDGITTVDGWKLSFNRAVISIGRASLGSDCVGYSNARYDRVLDVTQGEAQPLSILYGLGACDVRFGIEPPASDSLLGTGVNEALKTLMRTPMSDAYVQGGGITMVVDGQASAGGMTKKFHWQFLQPYRYEGCTVELDGQAVGGVVLNGGDALSYDIAIAPERLFLDDIEDTAQLRFAPFTNADDAGGNGDGEITFDELAQVSIADARQFGPYTAGAGGKGDMFASLLDYVYLALFPRVPRFRDTGSCTPSAGRGGGHHD